MNQIGQHNLFKLYKLLDYLHSPGKDIMEDEFKDFINSLTQLASANDHDLSKVSFITTKMFLNEEISCHNLEEAYQRYSNSIVEDAVAVNNVGDGRIAGTDNNPPVRNRKKITLLHRRKLNGSSRPPNTV